MIQWIIQANKRAKRRGAVDESYFGARRVKGKRGRGALGKTIVFGIHERGGKVYTEVVDDASQDQPQVPQVSWSRLIDIINDQPRAERSDQLIHIITSTLQGIIRGKVDASSVINSDG